MKKSLSIIFFILLAFSCSKKDDSDTAKVIIKIQKVPSSQKSFGTGEIEFVSDINCVAVMVNNPIDPTTSSCKDENDVIIAIPQILTNSVMVNTVHGAQIDLTIKKGNDVNFKVIAFKSSIIPCPNLSTISDKQQSNISYPVIIGDVTRDIVGGSTTDVNIITDFASKVYIAECKGSINMIEAGEVSDIAPVANTITPSDIFKNTELMITLSYSDSDSDQATSCTSSGLSNLIVTT